jgi:hypothetical protein
MLAIVRIRNVDSLMTLQRRLAKICKICIELTPDRAWDDAALCSPDFPVGCGASQ